MLFNSIEYLFFLPIVFAIYWLLRKHLRWQNAFVVVASYVFYGWWDWRFLILIAFTSLCSYASGLLIGRNLTPNNVLRTTTGSPIEQSSSPVKGRSKIWLIANIAINLGILGIFKYYDFFVTEFCGLFRIEASHHLLNVILPVGISFYTFQALSYSIDVYRKKIEPTKDIIAFFAFISFFPQLVAGPIERATNLLPQFLQNRKFDYDQATDGMRQILWGLFKKIVIADNCATYVDQVWNTYGTQSGSTLLLAAVLFTFQIYGDFSGYSDIAIGTAKLFGIKLMRNFNNPYFSRDIAEFWRRWHISLTTWFRDYVYIPLGGSRNGQWRTIANTFIVFLLCAIWHGANWTYLVWGLYHVALFIPLILLKRRRVIKNAESTVADSNLNSLESQSACKQASSQTTVQYCDTETAELSLHDSLQKCVIRDNLEKCEKQISKESVGRVIQMVLTFAFVTIGWIIFRAPTVADAWGYMSGMIDASLVAAPMMAGVWRALGLVAIMVVVEWMNRNEEHGFAIAKLPRWGRVFAMYALIFSILFFMGESQPFIYFQF